MLALAVLPAFGLINPRFTPTELVRSSEQVLLLKVSVPKDNVVAAEVVETLRGTAPAEKKMSLHLEANGELNEETVQAAFNQEATAAAVLVLSPADNLDLTKDPLGAIQVGRQWFAVFKKDGKLSLDTDRQELGTVWAGSARMLAAATRYVEQDPTASFPVKSNMVWGGDLNLGKLPGRANRCLAADLGEPVGPCAIVLCDGGDRVYQAGAKGEKPSDATEKLKLRTASKIAALGDFSGHGRLDLASWNGKTLAVAGRLADGTFAPAQTIAADLTQCLSLEAIDVGSKAGAGLIVGTREGPLLAAPDGAGGFTLRPIAAAAKELAKEMGEGGLCVAADFDRHGRCDVIQLFSKGLLTYAGEAPGRFKAPVKTALRLPEKPCVAICGDFDGDGWLDLIVGGEGSLALLARDEKRQWQNQSFVTGELAYHGGANQPKIIGAALSDINGDGRQGATLFYADRKPMAFFNRGFACFGWARELDSAGAPAADATAIPGQAAPPAPVLKSQQALDAGQSAGAVLDLNGDGIPDMLAVDPATQDVWVLLGENQEGPRTRTLSVALAPEVAGPLVVTVREATRCVGMYVVRPGVPAIIGRTHAGPVSLEWIDAEGKPVTRKVVVVKNFTRVTIP
jgi:hypothetical protein